MTNSDEETKIVLTQSPEMVQSKIKEEHQFKEISLLKEQKMSLLNEINKLKGKLKENITMSQKKIQEDLDSEEYTHSHHLYLFLNI